MWTGSKRDIASLESKIQSQMWKVDVLNISSSEFGWVWFWETWKSRKRQCVCIQEFELLQLLSLNICSWHRSNLEISLSDEIQITRFLEPLALRFSHISECSSSKSRFWVIEIIKYQDFDVQDIKSRNIPVRTDQITRYLFSIKFMSLGPQICRSFCLRFPDSNFESVFWVVESINQDHLKFPEHPNSKHSFCVDSWQGR